MTAKILFLDIETAPSLGWAWAKWQTDIIDFKESWYLLSFAYKWIEDNEVTCRALPDYSARYNRSRRDDSLLCADLWALLDAADIVVAHNGDSFDIKKSNARFISHSMSPPSTYKTVDTLKLARKHFKFESNKLTDLGKFLEVGVKLPHTGFSLWAGCMEGDPKAWDTMKEYNTQDVYLLEQVYYKLRPWAANHPNLALYSDPLHPVGHTCPTCQSDHVQRRGFNYAKLQVRQRWHCTGCGTWWSGAVIKKSELENA